MGGMKPGTGDDPYADTEDTDRTDPGESAKQRDPQHASSDADSGASPGERTLPYKFARDSVKDGRNQRPIFLRDEVENQLPELLSELEDRLGEDVYKTDVQEAAIVTAIEHPNLVAEKLREWGYDWQ